MKYLKLFETFFLDKTKDQPVHTPKETEKNTHTIYTDNKLSIKVVKTLDSSKSISDPQWCSTSSQGFYKHNLTSNMYRFIYKDGYKLRLTWDYLNQNDTHWGQGGVIGTEKASYSVLRPYDNTDPFNIIYEKNDGRQYMVNRIHELPKEAVESIKKYQNQHTIEKSALLKGLYKEIEKIKIVNIEATTDDYYSKHSFYKQYDIYIEYLGKKYKINGSLFDYGFRFYGTKFKSDFKNQYAFTEYNTITTYLKDKSMEWLKANNKSEYLLCKSEGK